MFQNFDTFGGDIEKVFLCQPEKRLKIGSLIGVFIPTEKASPKSGENSQTHGPTNPHVLQSNRSILYENQTLHIHARPNARRRTRCTLEPKGLLH